MEKRGNRGNFPQFPRFFNVSLPAKGVSPGPAGRVWIPPEGRPVRQRSGHRRPAGCFRFLQPARREQVTSWRRECLGSQPDKAGLSVRWIMHLIADPGAGIRIGRRGTLLRKALRQSSQLRCDGLRCQHGAQAVHHGGIAGTPAGQHICPQGHQRPAKSGLEPQGHSLRGIRVREGGHLRRGGLIKRPELALRCRLRSGGSGKALLPKAGQVLKSPRPGQCDSGRPDGRAALRQGLKLGL